MTAIKHKATDALYDTFDPKNNTEKLKLNHHHAVFVLVAQLS
jgi:hypothetical protein